MSATATGWIDRARRFLGEGLWSWDLRPRSLGAAAVRTLQLVVMIGEGFMRDQLLLRASALTYIATLSMIPMLVVVVSIMNGLGFGDEIVELAVDNLAFGIPDAQSRILELVRGARLGALGTIGAAMMVVSTVLVLRHGETTLNEIWGVQKSRTWMRRLADYLLVIFVVPLVTVAAFSLDGALQSATVVERLLHIPAFELVYHMGLRFMPALLLVAGFTFVYWFLPNTAVRIGSATLGAVVAALLLVVAQRIFVDFIVGAAKYNVLFGSFAALPLVLFWLYLAFSIVLLGAEVSFAHQNLSQYRRAAQGGVLHGAERESLGLGLTAEIARTFRDRQPARSADALADHLELPIRAVRELLGTLEEAGILATLAADEGGETYQLAAPPDQIPVSNVLSAVRGDRRIKPAEGSQTALAVRDTLQEIDEKVAAVADRRTLTDLLETVPAEDPELA